jgi:hypothetical protein
VSRLWDGRTLGALTWLALAACCAPPLFLQFLPMTELPQYVALSRMVWHLSDPSYGFAPYYELALDRSIAALPLYVLGGLGELLPHAAATRIVTWLSVLSYPLGLCLLLRMQGKPTAYALLGLPLVYSVGFYVGLLPSLASTGLALCVMALMHGSPRARIALGMVSLLLSLTHPFGVSVALAYTLSWLCLSRRSWRQAPWLALTPLALGSLYWGVRALNPDGVAGFDYPGLTFRLFHLPESVLGGFLGRGEAYLLGAQLVVWLLLCRGHVPTNRARWRSLSEPERALWLTAGLCAVGYLVLPSSAAGASAINLRAGSMAFALLPALLPAEPSRLGAPRERAAALLLALAACTIGYTSSQLIRFDREAQLFAPVLARMPARPKLISLIYQNHGELARSAPYVHFGAYAQAERGGFLALSRLDYAPAVPLRRRADAPAPAPVYGSEWNPVVLHNLPLLFQFYDAVLTHGPEPREMTIMAAAGFRLAAQSGTWLLFTRHAGPD